MINLRITIILITVFFTAMLAGPNLAPASSAEEINSEAAKALQILIENQLQPENWLKKPRPSSSFQVLPRPASLSAGSTEKAPS